MLNLLFPVHANVVVSERGVEHGNAHLGHVATLREGAGQATPLPGFQIRRTPESDQRALSGTVRGRARGLSGVRTPSEGEATGAQKQAAPDLWREVRSGLD